MAELLLEIFSEEIPARMQGPAAEQLRKGIAALTGSDDVRSFVTPRRLCVVADGVPTVQPDVTEERRGPRVGAPEKATQGFLRSVGFDTLDQCEQREDKKGTFYYAVMHQKGRPTADVLAEEIPQLIAGFSWPKSMRWGSGSQRWVRPLHSVLCLFDGEVVPGSLELGGGAEDIAFSGQTRGHRWLAPETIVLRSFDDYRSKLAAAKVMLDAEERRNSILDQAEALAARAKLTLERDDALLAEVSGLVEWPVCLLGTFDEAFLDVPPEVLITSMKSHQKYFPLRDGDGKLANRFVVVSNMEADDGGAAICAGNERVLRARLHDARFFWEQDRQRSLESRIEGLEGMVFHAKLGSLGAKVARLETLIGSVAAFVPGADEALAVRAAKLCKTDLLTGMVGEFASLQGIMGRYYAQNDGEDAAVGDAIAEHYSPAGPSDRCPSAPVSVALALADRIDTLAGFFLIDERPTGSKDPFALRRAALGVIRLILDNGLRVPLRRLFASAVEAYGQGGDAGEVAESILVFFADRLRVHMREQGLRHDVVSAVMTVADDDDLVRLAARADALRGFLESDDGANLLTAFRRAANIVRIEEK
ncbi:MAG: glycine--tRNA ligase subunit beta, partial [Alphaproteobacteria bacterium]|nr:glycine--tRNA ligase subunit beta [Alphaproteobacteria bacterium]